jgi:hypothetical protein
MFTNAMDFFNEHTSLKKPIPKHFFTSLLSDLSIKDLITFGNLLSTKNLKPQRWFYATESKQAWLPQDLKNKVLKPSVNRRIIGLALRPQNVYDNQKR